MNRYQQAKAIYSKYGVDTDRAIQITKDIPISIHCWQGDDVTGFENDSTLSGGIQATGNYPGKATSFEELKADFLEALKYIPGQKRINLHAMYAVTNTTIERNKLKPEHFKPWLDFAIEHDLKIDFNPTFFAHPMVKDNLSLSSPDDDIRAFWVEHGIACRDIAAYIGEKQGSPCLFNIWIPDGMKDIPGDRLGPRKRLENSLDQILKKEYSDDIIIDSVESKVFGIGLESYTVGSSEFYMNYAQKKGICCLLDNGHYHPTENVADKISSMLLFNKYVALHVTRPVRWDSDHVVRLDDAIQDIANEIIASNQPERFLIGLDFFDASINRVAAWVIGTRNFQKALLKASLIPYQELEKIQVEGDFTKLLALQEELKTLPFYDVWEAYCKEHNILSDFSWYENVMQYESVALKKGR
ncbi:MAG: L-rhamnose isomerase [Candidatus Izemoplasmataceae bacterium]